MRMTSIDGFRDIRSFAEYDILVTTVTSNDWQMCVQRQFIKILCHVSSMIYISHYIFALLELYTN